MGNAAAAMDRMYRRQRHVYDLSRKFYLLGRDEAIRRVRPDSGHSVLEIACGTGRNLIQAARLYPHARFYGLDVSEEMLATARASIRRAGLASRIAVARGDATRFDPKQLFGEAGFDRVLISYALSMIPPWREALGQGFDAVAPNGALCCVDFGDFGDLPGAFRAGLRAWLSLFEVKPVRNLDKSFVALARSRGFDCSTERLRRGYAVLATAHRQSGSADEETGARSRGMMP
jgi:S-adenosylmethionine-diacylgycerolhomoserine-N-methlytransferase